MATTKIWKIKNRMDHVIEYATNKEKTVQKQYLNNALLYAVNPTKTENKKYVTGLNCMPETAFKDMSIVKRQFNKTGGILGFHAYQSFKGYEVSADEAHEIGIRLAEELWGGRFQVVVTTHLNTKNVHNHFVINSVSFVDGKKYYDSKKTYAVMRRTSDAICKEFGLTIIKENDFYKETGSRYARSSKYLNQVREDIDYAIAQARNYNEFKAILKDMDYELTNRNDVLSIRKEPYNRNIRLERTFGEEYEKESIVFRIKNTTTFKLPFPEVRTLTGKYKSKTPIKHKPKAKGLRALYLYYCYLFKVFPKDKFPLKLSEHMKEEIKKMDQFSNAVRFLGKNNLTTLAEVKEYKENAIKEMNKLKGKRENLWRKHKRVKTNEEKQYICSQIPFLATRIHELSNYIKLCDFIEERSLKLNENIKDLDTNNMFIYRNKEYYR